MEIQKKKDFLINSAYWGLVLVLGYLVCAYLIPVAMPFIIGAGVARLVVGISRRLHCPKKWLRVLLTLLLYGALAAGVGFLATKAASLLSHVAAWLPELYRLKLQPFGQAVYAWATDTIQALNPAMLRALELLSDSLVAATKNLITMLSTGAVGMLSGIAKGVPKFLLGLLAMILSTVFVSNDYERLRAFTIQHTSPRMKALLSSLKTYLTGTLLVVLRSYLLIMLLTFTELSILFSLFGIDSPLPKAALIALLDILPILGTGGILIPWAVVSLVLGYTSLAIKLLVIYGIVLVVRNYAEPRIVGAQLGLHPVISLAAMFIGLRLFGFWGMLGLPIAISYLWKQRKEFRL